MNSNPFFLKLNILLFSGLLPLNLYPGEVPNLKGDFTLKCESYEVDISATYAYTIHKITFEGVALVLPTGFCGNIFLPGPGKFIGAGHTEGGVEGVESILLEVDGKEASPEINKTFEGKSICWTKTARLANLWVKVVMNISPDGVEIHKFFEAMEDQKAYAFYIFQFPYSIATKEWIAELANGQFKEGEFIDDNGWRLCEDVKWTALYIPESEKGMLMYYPKVIPGALHKSGYWDVKGRYHKYYLMMEIPKLIPRGKKSEAYALTMRGFSSEPSKWKETVKKIADRLKAK